MARMVLGGKRRLQQVSEWTGCVRWCNRMEMVEVDKDKAKEDMIR